MREEIHFFPSNDKSMEMYIDIAGISYCDGSYHILRPNSDITVIEYILSGEGYLSLHGALTPVRKDQIYILPKGIDHDYFSSESHPWTKIFMNIGGDLPLQLLSAYRLNEKNIFSGNGLRPKFEHILQALRQEPVLSHLQAELCGAFVELLVSLHLSEKEQIHSSEGLQLKNYLDSHAGELVSNQELSSYIFRSSDYCIKLFRKEFGTTPYEYQLCQKIKIACQLLKNTTLSVGEIAAAVGYSDPHYFSNLFFARQGIRPKDYRKRHGRQ